MRYNGFNSEKLRYKEYIPSLNKRSSELMNKCFNEHFKNFDILVIKESVRSGNGATHLLALIKNELILLDYSVLPIYPFIMDTFPELSFSTIANYEYILMDGFYPFKIKKSYIDIKNLIEHYLSNGGRIIFTTGKEYSQSSFIKNAKEIVLQTGYPSYQTMRKIVYFHRKEYIEVFELFGKTIYNNVDTIREFEGYLISIVAFTKLHALPNYNCIEFYFQQGNPILKEINK